MDFFDHYCKAVSENYKNSSSDKYPSHQQTITNKYGLNLCCLQRLISLSQVDSDWWSFFNHSSAERKKVMEAIPILFLSAVVSTSVV